ncbi:MAG TPA: zinc-binding dehydrogenase [Aggregatilineales bacterium]|nr:zinc-binding dehydrogenase [Anaerolineales bacterium]HRE49499.1 zinc-binding dehydrogenase [Aggregatilineales bacterium]
MTIPTTMQAVVLHRYDANYGGITVEERPVPQPKAGEVLVKMIASPINPSDLLFMQGRYGFTRPTPTVPGFEGCGIVVAANGGIGRFYLNRRVAAVVQQVGDGVWADYVTVPARMVLPMGKGISDEQAAMSAVNPMTAWALIDISQRGKHKTILHTAAGSALGKMLWRLGQARGVEVVGIVRRPEQADDLRAMGMKHILCSTALDFDEQVKAITREMRIRLCFDAVGGTTASRILRAMPRHSTLRVYGALSGEVSASADTLDLIFKDKTLSGFWLSDYIGEKGILRLALIGRHVQKLLGSDLSSEVRARYPFAKAHEAIRDYESAMSAGKVLFVSTEGTP